MADLQDTVRSVKDTVTSPLPSPEPMQAKSSANELKERLDWGEPALTILDVRSREQFQQERILGAVNVELHELLPQVQNVHGIETNRDIYLYGENAEQVSDAARQLRGAGYIRVAEIEGGLPAWKECGGSIEGVNTKDDYSGTRLTFTTDDQSKG
ncbi:MAG: rhodanese-like domain-containing protein [Synechococcales bacterium]|nr:rhodanese-like domain-containing protein [Synechococcales bacterium]